MTAPLLPCRKHAGRRRPTLDDQGAVVLRAAGISVISCPVCCSQIRLITSSQLRLDEVNRTEDSGRTSIGKSVYVFLDNCIHFSLHLFWMVRRESFVLSDEYFESGILGTIRNGQSSLPSLIFGPGSRPGSFITVIACPF